MKNIYKPILFSTPMVQAILEGRKTQTRRIVKNQDRLKDVTILDNVDDQLHWLKIGWKIEPKYFAGDILWVREKFASKEINEEPPGDVAHYYASDSFASEKWRPSIHMPKKACRIFLKVKSIKIEKLHDISENDSIAEGCSKYGPFGEYRGSVHPNGGMMKYRAYSKACRAFQCIWESINGSDSWTLNPFVWVIEFERIDKPLDFI